MPGSSRRKLPPVLLATSNRGKLAEAREVLAGFGIAVKQFDGKGIEIQADKTSEVAAFSSRGAAISAGSPVLVEDAGLFIHALGGFPGPYSAYVFKTVGLDGVLSLLRGRTPRKARFVSSLAYCKPGGEPVVFEGLVQGEITRSPRGSMGFGFDPIFLPAGGRRTFGELSLREKCAVSHRARALTEFARWYASAARTGRE